MHQPTQSSLNPPTWCFVACERASTCPLLPRQARVGSSQMERTHGRIPPDMDKPRHQRQFFSSLSTPPSVTLEPGDTLRADPWLLSTTKPGPVPSSFPPPPAGFVPYPRVCVARWNDTEHLQAELAPLEDGVHFVASVVYHENSFLCTVRAEKRKARICMSTFQGRFAKELEMRVVEPSWLAESRVVSRGSSWLGSAE